MPSQTPKAVLKTHALTAGGIPLTHQFGTSGGFCLSLQTDDDLMDRRRQIAGGPLPTKPGPPKRHGKDPVGAAGQVADRSSQDKEVQNFAEISEKNGARRRI